MSHYWTLVSYDSEIEAPPEEVLGGFVKFAQIIFYKSRIVSDENNTPKLEIDTWGGPTSIWYEKGEGEYHLHWRVPAKNEEKFEQSLRFAIDDYGTKLYREWFLEDEDDELPVMFYNPFSVWWDLLEVDHEGDTPPDPKPKKVLKEKPPTDADRIASGIKKARFTGLVCGGCGCELSYKEYGLMSGKVVDDKTVRVAQHYKCGQCGYDGTASKDVEA